MQDIEFVVGGLMRVLLAPIHDFLELIKTLLIAQVACSVFTLLGVLALLSRDK